MAKHKLPPRQKMINLMYLIFIAMLAMNIDREVLRSFAKTNATLQDVVKQTSFANNSFYAGLQKKKVEDPERYTKVYEDAKVAKDKSDKLIRYLDDLKQQLGVKDINASDEDLDYKILESSEILNKMFFKAGALPTKKALEFKQKIEDFKKFLLSRHNLTQEDRIRINRFFSTTSKNKKRNWLNETFYEQPNVASLTNISLLETNIRDEESKIVSSMLATKLIEDIELKSFEAIIVAPSTIKQGEPATARILLGAYDSSVKSKVVANGVIRQMDKGQAEFSLDTDTTGYHDLKGEVSYINGAGKTITYPFEQRYYVAGEIIKEKIPNIAYGEVTADKMNVVYRGLKNPMSATMSGAKDGTVKLKASLGTLIKTGRGKYDYIPDIGKTVEFTVTGTTPKGKIVKKKKVYRIKNLPKPQGMVRGESTLSLPVSSVGKITVEAGFPNFLFDIKTKVVSFKVKVPVKLTIDCKGNRMNAEAKAAIAGLRRGQSLQIFGIKATSTIPIKDATPVIITIK